MVASRLNYFRNNYVVVNNIFIWFRSTSHQIKEMNPFQCEIVVNLNTAIQIFKESNVKNINLLGILFNIVKCIKLIQDI